MKLIRSGPERLTDFEFSFFAFLKNLSLGSELEIEKIRVEFSFFACLKNQSLGSELEIEKIRVKLSRNGPERLTDFEFVFRMVSKIYLSGPELEMKKNTSPVGFVFRMVSKIHLSGPELEMKKTHLREFQ